MTYGLRVLVEYKDYIRAMSIYNVTNIRYTETEVIFESSFRGNESCSIPLSDIATFDVSVDTFEPTVSPVFALQSWGILLGLTSNVNYSSQVE